MSKPKILDLEEFSDYSGSMAGETFTSEDVALLAEVVSMDDMLLAAAHATKLIESVVAYPIESVSQLKVTFDQNARNNEFIYVGRCTLSWEKIERYFGKSRFPIRNRQKLLSAIIVSLKKERIETLASVQGMQAISTSLPRG